MDEMRDVVSMLLHAYAGTSAFVNAVYPHKITEDGIEGLDMIVAWLNYLWDIVPSICWFKVTETGTGEVVSASQWNVYDESTGKPEEMMLDGPPGAWADDTEKRYAVEMFKAFIAPRYARYREVDLPFMCLNIMGTAKSWQHKGAAGLMVRHMTGMADEMDALVSVPHAKRVGRETWVGHYADDITQITTESTSAARWLYEKNGFVVSKDPGHWVIEATSEEFKSRPKERLFFMERPRTKNAA